LHSLREKLEALRGDGCCQRRFAREVPIRRIRGYPNNARRLAQAEGFLSSLDHKPHGGCDHRVSEISMVVGGDSSGHGNNVDSVNIGCQFELVRTPKMIAVSGATGRQGGAVIRHLLKSGGFRVRAISRNKNSPVAARLASQGAEVVEADFDNAPSLEKALAGADGVFSVQNYWEKGIGFDGEIRQGKNLANAAKTAGVKHFVQSTMATGAMGFSAEMKHFRSKAVLEDHIDRIGLPRTFLGTVTFMDNVLFSELGGAWTFPFLSGILGPATPYHLLAVDDIGGVAAAVFAESERFIGRKINLAGDTSSVPELKIAYREVTGKNPKRLKFPVWLCRMINKEFVCQLEWQRAGGWTFGTEEARAVYPGMASFQDFLVQHGVKNL
jgi:uncharacterized protein YbjT (DUF2867 family)